MLIDVSYYASVKKLVYLIQSRSKEDARMAIIKDPDPPTGNNVMIL